MRVTKKRIRGGLSGTIDINVDGERVASAHISVTGPGWSARSEAHGIEWFNSWAEGIRYESVSEAADAALAHVKARIKAKTSREGG